MNEVRDSLDGLMFAQLIGFVAFIAFILLSIDQNGANFNVDFVFCVNCLIAESFMNFVSCYYGDMVGSRFYEVADVAYASFWYKLPMNEQKFIRRIIERGQRRFCLTGYKMFVCSMETFLQVL